MLRTYVHARQRATSRRISCPLQPHAARGPGGAVRCAARFKKTAVRVRCATDNQRRESARLAVRPLRGREHGRGRGGVGGDVLSSPRRPVRVQAPDRRGSGRPGRLCRNAGRTAAGKAHGESALSSGESVRACARACAHAPATRTQVPRLDGKRSRGRDERVTVRPSARRWRCGPSCQPERALPLLRGLISPRLLSASAFGYRLRPGSCRGFPSEGFGLGLPEGS